MLRLLCVNHEEVKRKNLWIQLIQACNFSRQLLIFCYKSRRKRDSGANREVEENFVNLFQFLVEHLKFFVALTLNYWLLKDVSTRNKKVECRNANRTYVAIIIQSWSFRESPTRRGWWWRRVAHSAPASIFPNPCVGNANKVTVCYLPRRVNLLMDFLQDNILLKCRFRR